MKVGLSLGCCIADLIKGRGPALEDIKFISANTNCQSGEHWDGVIRAYRVSYWSANPAEGERLARYFIEQGLIIQPKLEGHYMTGVGSLWIDEGEYNDYAFGTLSKRTA